MICPRCNYKNDATTMYCRACGAQIRYTDSKVKGTLKEEIEQQQADQWEEQTRQFLVLGIALFLIAVTWKIVFSNPDPPKCYILPPCSDRASYAAVKYEHPLVVEKEILTVPEK